MWLTVEQYRVGPLNDEFKFTVAGTMDGLCYSHATVTYHAADTQSPQQLVMLTNSL